MTELIGCPLWVEGGRWRWAKLLRQASRRPIGVLTKRAALRCNNLVFKRFRFHYFLAGSCPPIACFNGTIGRPMV